MNCCFACKSPCGTPPRSMWFLFPGSWIIWVIMTFTMYPTMGLFYSQACSHVNRNMWVDLKAQTWVSMENFIDYGDRFRSFCGTTSVHLSLCLCSWFTTSFLNMTVLFMMIETITSAYPDQELVTRHPRRPCPLSQPPPWGSVFRPDGITDYINAQTNSGSA